MTQSNVVAVPYKAGSMYRDCNTLDELRETARMENLLRFLENATPAEISHYMGTNPSQFFTSML